MSVPPLHPNLRVLVLREKYLDILSKSGGRVEKPRKPLCINDYSLHPKGGTRVEWWKSKKGVIISRLTTSNTNQKQCETNRYRTALRG